MQKPPLKKRGKPPSGPSPLIAEIMAATAAGGYELSGSHDRKSAAQIRRLLNYHGQQAGVRFSVSQTAAGGLWIERAPPAV